MRKELIDDGAQHPLELIQHEMPTLDGSGARPVAPVSAVVCTHLVSRWELCQQAVASILDQTSPPREIVLVVDGNADLAALARSRYGHDPAFTIVALNGPGGLSNARNMGLEAAGEEFVLFVDDDGRLEPTTVEMLLAEFTSGDVLGVSGRVVPAWESGEPSWMPPELLWTLGCTHQELLEVTEVRNLFGAVALFRSSLFQRVGGFDTALGRVGKNTAGGEETEICIRAHRLWSGAIFKLVPQTVMHHSVPPERSQVSYVVRRCWGEGLSKAVLARMSGGEVLDVERTFLLVVIPRAVGRHVWTSIRTGRVHGLARAGVLAAGVLATSSSYVLAAGRLRLAARSPKDDLGH